MSFERVDDPERLKALIDAILLLEVEMELPKLLRHVVETAVDLAGATYGALGVLDAEGQALAQFITVGLEAEIERSIGDRPKGIGVLGLLIVDPKPIRLARLSDNPQSSPLPPGHPEMSSFLGVPIRAGGCVFGNLYLTDKVGAQEFSQEDEDLLVTLGVAAGIAIDNARLHSRLRHVALLEERERMARDFHDTVIQRLFAVGLTLQSAILRVTDEVVTERLESSVDMLDDTIHQIRATIFSLGKAGRTGDSLLASAREVISEMVDSLGFEPSIRADGPVDTAVGPDQSREVIAVLREGLANVARHAKAHSVDIDVQVGDELVLRLVDDGIGLPEGLSPTVATGHGLGHIVARAERLGGSCSVMTREGGGTELCWMVPLHP
ncbi:MAG: GAF domain-containing sensor histidine kinase [Acidimicrobiales bacterium]